MIDIKQIEKIVTENFNNAKGKLVEIRKVSCSLSEQAISDRVPGYAADLLEFGDFNEDNFSVLFIDMRGSTKRAQTIGAEKTFLSMHAYIPAMLEVIKCYDGHVVDLMGDGIMVFFGGSKSSLTKIQAAQNAGLCGLDMLRVLDEVVNKILNHEKIWKISCGVGVDYGKVVVTKIGIDGIFDVKAYGDCINKAAKFSDDAQDEVLVSETINNLWPIGKNGKMKLKLYKNDAYKLER